MEAQLASGRSNRIVDQRERETKYVDIKEAAALLHLSTASVRRYLTIKRLKRYKVGQGISARTLLDREQVMSLIVPAEN